MNRNKKIVSARYYLVVLCWILMGLFFIISPSFDMHFYSQPPIALEGKLGEVGTKQKSMISVYVDGNPYVLYKEVYSLRSFGFLDDIKIAPLIAELQGKRGADVRIEYLEMGAKEDRIVDLTINGVNYVNKNGAIHDFIRDQNGVRIFGLVLILIGFFLYMLLRRGTVRE